MMRSRKQAIKLIKEYFASEDMKELEVLIREAIKSKCPDLEMEVENIWRDLPDKVIYELAYLCIKEENKLFPDD